MNGGRNQERFSYTDRSSRRIELDSEAESAQALSDASDIAKKTSASVVYA